MANWNLIIEDDAGKTIVVPLARDQITIGRKEGNTIRLTERNVSRFHAKLVRENGHVFIEDLQSYNGIKVNGDKIQGRIPIHEGDLIEIGDYHLALQAQDAAEPALAGATMPQPPRPVPTLKMSAIEAPTQTNDDDEFAGDTQRWEPPANMEPLPVGHLATMEESPRETPTLSNEATLPVAPARDSQPTLDERVPVDTAKLQRQENMAPPHGWPPPGPPGQPGAPTFAGLDTHGQQVPPPPRAAHANGNGAAAHAHLEETVRTTSAPNRAAAPQDLPTASPFDVIEDAREPKAAPPPPRPQPAEPIVRGLEPTQPMPAPPVKPAMKPASAPPAPVAKVHEEQTETLKPAPTPGPDAELQLPRLVVLNTVFAGSTFAIRAPETVVGRTEDNDITIEHRSVSRNHAKLMREGDKIRIIDLKSANGVLVNGEEVDGTVLRPGDVIELGRVRIRYVPPGERFVVPPDEIERARVADVAGDDFNDEQGTHITSPLRAQAARPLAQKSRLPLVAAGVGFLVVLLTAAVLLLAGGDEGDGDAPQPQPTGGLPEKAPPPEKAEPPPVQAAAVEPPPVEEKPAPPPDPAQVALSEMDAAIQQGDIPAASAALSRLPKGHPEAKEARSRLETARKTVVDENAKAADQAIRSANADVAREAIAVVKELDPKNPKLISLERRLAALDKSTADKAGSERKEDAAKRPSRDVDAEATAASSEAGQARARDLVREATAASFAGDLQKALSLLLEARELAPRLPDVHRNLGVVYARVGKKDDAYRAYKQFLRLQPNGSEAEKVRAIVEQYEAVKGTKAEGSP